jgi:hypothetical protein
VAGSDKKRPRGRPATTVEEKENQLLGLATDLAEQHLREGTASSQLLTQILKQSSPRETLERQRLQAEVKLLEARVEALSQAGRMEELYSEAIRAMRSYSGQEDPDDQYYDQA